MTRKPTDRAVQAEKMKAEVDKSDILAALTARGFEVSDATWTPACDGQAHGDVYLQTYVPAIFVRVRAYVDGRGDPPRRFAAAIGLNCGWGWVWTNRHATAAKALDAAIRRARRDVAAEQHRFSAVADALKQRKARA